MSRANIRSGGITGLFSSYRRRWHPAEISVTGSGNTLHLAGTTDHDLFHTIRFADRAWQRFADVSGAVGPVTAHALTIAVA